MGFLYQHDGQRLRPEFTCPCGSKRAERVNVKRPDGSLYETEFARCYTCCAMYHWPHPVPALGGISRTLLRSGLLGRPARRSQILSLDGERCCRLHAAHGS